MQFFLNVLSAGIIILTALLLPAGKAYGQATTNSTSAAEDAYVRGGTSATSNFGSSSVLEVRFASGADSVRMSYLKFDTSAISGVVTKATLRLYGEYLGAGSNAATKCHAVTNDSWSESTVTWNTKPSNAQFLFSRTIGTASQYYEWEVTTFVKDELNNNETLVSFVLLEDTVHSDVVQLNSKENASFQPELVIIATPNTAPTVSITSPTDGEVFPAGSTIVVDVSASDPDGTIQGVQVFAGTVSLGIDIVSPYSFTWNSVPTGEYQLTAKATDNLGQISTSDPVSILVDLPDAESLLLWLRPENLADLNDGDPVALWPDSAQSNDASQSLSNATPVFISDAIKGRGAVRFDGSNDFLNLPAGFATFADGLSLFVVVQPSSKAVNSRFIEFGNSGPSDNIFLGRAGTTSRVEYRTYTGTNATVHLGADNQIAQLVPQLFEVIHATNRISLYKNGILKDTLAREKRIEDVSRNNNLIGLSSFSSSAPFAGDIAEIILFDGAIAAADRSKVEKYLADKYGFRANQAPIVTLTSPTTNLFAAPAKILLAAEAADVDGTIKKVQFFEGTNLLGTDSTSPYRWPWANVGFGEYSLTAKAVDNSGGVTVSSPLNITVNKLPFVEMTGPENVRFDAYKDITLTANASDKDGTIETVEFFDGTQLIAEVTGSPYEVEWNTVMPGVHYVTAKATDNLGGTKTSKPLRLIGSLPTSASLRLWLQANAIKNASNGLPVAVWPDLSGNGIHASQVADPNARPIYLTNSISGNPALRFDGTNDFMTLANSTIPTDNQPYSVFAVVKGENGKRAFLGAGADVTQEGRLNSFGFHENGELYNSWGTLGVGSSEDFLTKPNTITAGSNYVVCFTYSPSNGRKAFLNGVQKGEHPLSTRSGDDAMNLVGLGVDSLHWKGDIAEIVVYGSDISNSQRENVEAYLASKYNIVDYPIVPPVFSQPKSRFNAEVTVGMSTPTVGAEIRFTTDGKEPTKDSELYVEPITFPESVYIKAKSFKTGFLPSRTSIMFYDNTTGHIDDIDGLTLWLKADAGITQDASGGVSEWVDQSDADMDATQVLKGLRPVFVNGSNAPSISFDGLNDYLQLASGFNDFSQGLSLFIVTGPLITTNSARFIDLASFNSSTGNTANGIWLTDAFPTLRYRTQKGQSSSTTIEANVISNDDMQLFEIVDSGNDQGSVTMYKDGSSEISEDSHAIPIIVRTRNFIGKGNGASSEFLGGEISEIILYNRALTPEERAQVEEYLLMNYGL